MRIKLDENLSVRLKPFLHESGHNVSTVKDESLLSHPDTAIASACRAEDRMLFTLDIEFADLRKYPPGSHPGIVLFRPVSYGPLSTINYVMSFLKKVNIVKLRGCVTVVDPSAVRVRKPETDK
jgi:predicted nuclease of predicted toxin-antitoxin system